MTAKTISRRGAIAVAAATIGATALPAAPSSARADATLVGEPSAFTPSFLVPPAPIDEASVKQTYECDVCVVGLGLAGVCALRETAESGAKAIGIEKGPDVGYRSDEFGTFGSQIHKQLGIEQPETREVVDALMRAMGNRPNAQLLNYWIANSGPDLDGTWAPSSTSCSPATPTRPPTPRRPTSSPSASPSTTTTTGARKTTRASPACCTSCPTTAGPCTAPSRPRRRRAPRSSSTAVPSSSPRTSRAAWWAPTPPTRTATPSA